MLPSRVPCPPYAYAYVCACVCACVRGRRVLLCVEGRGGREVMLPWRVPCSPDESFLKKRGMPARCTSVGVMLGVLLRLARVLLLHHHLLTLPDILGDCCLLILQRLCIKWWGGGFVCVCQCVCARALSPACVGAHCARLHRHTHSGLCPCWDAMQASGLSLARKKRRLSVESMGNPRPHAQ